MNLDYNLYVHESDRAALKSLKAIPGFSQVAKAFMKIWSEKQFNLIIMSTNLRLGPNQMAKYYNMLPPICEKLGIEVPDLYLEQNVRPNAYTYGDTKPFIVMTSGLLETMPEELIPTVLAHECGHIACHHTLYTTMGRAVLTGASGFIGGLGSLVLYPIQLAFEHWMRCSELSADRAAIICDGSADKTIEMCMRFSGYNKSNTAETSVDEFMKQAQEYKALVKDSAWNKTLEFILFQNNSHPLNAVRAYEAKEWGASEKLARIFKMMETGNYSEYSPKTAEEALTHDILGDIKLPYGSRDLLGRDYQDVAAELMQLGFTNIEAKPVGYANDADEAWNLVSVSIGGQERFSGNSWFSPDVKIVLNYLSE